MAEHSSTTEPPQRRIGWAPPPSRTAPTPTESAPRIRMDAPYFNGDDPTGWISNIQKYFDYFYTTDDDRLLLVSIVIEHPADKWFRYYRYKNVDASWMEFLYAVKQRFDPDHFEDYSGPLSELQQETTVVADQTAFATLLNKDGVTDALNATKATVEEGIVPGGDVSLIYASNELDKLPTANFDQKSGVQIIQNALQTPVHSVTSNAGVEGAVVVSKLLQTDAFDQRTVLVHGESPDQWRIPWPDGSPDSWESVTVIHQHFPHIHLEDKVVSEDGGVDTPVPTSLTASRTPRIRQQPTRFAEYVT